MMVTCCEGVILKILAMFAATVLLNEICYVPAKHHIPRLLLVCVRTLPQQVDSSCLSNIPPPTPH